MTLRTLTCQVVYCLLAVVFLSFCRPIFIVSFSVINISFCIKPFQIAGSSLVSKSHYWARILEPEFDWVIPVSNPDYFLKYWLICSFFGPRNVKESIFMSTSEQRHWFSNAHFSMGPTFTATCYFLEDQSSDSFIFFHHVCHFSTTLSKWA